MDKKIMPSADGECWHEVKDVDIGGLGWAAISGPGSDRLRHNGGCSPVRLPFSVFAMENKAKSRALVCQSFFGRIGMAALNPPQSLVLIFPSAVSTVTLADR